MREIKFRAWNKVGQYMTHPSSTFIAPNGKNGEMKMDTPMSEEYELLEYTGLKDKNGKEIYEGDILVGINRNNIEMIAEVFFMDGCFQIKQGFRFPAEDQRKDYFLRGIFDGKELEVIGNIYENPELLKENG